MKLALMIWLPWVAFFLIAELVGMLTSFPTLSEVFWWLRDEALPPWASLLLSVVASMLFLWLATIHWIHSYADKPRLDHAEFLVLVLGAISGIVGHRKSRTPDT